MSIEGRITVGDIIAQSKRKKEEEFWSGLMWNATQTDDFDVSGGTPIYEEGASGLPSKDSSWRDYLQLKNGDVTPQEMSAFHQQYDALEQQRNAGQLQGLSKLGLQGVPVSRVREMVKDNPQLYNNLLDMTTKLQSTGDPNAIAMAGQFQSYLPQKGTLETAGEWTKENPGKAALGTVVAGVAATKFGPGIGDRLKKHFMMNPDVLLSGAEMTKGQRDRLGIKPSDGATLEQFLSDEITFNKEKNEYQWTDKHADAQKTRNKAAKKKGQKESKIYKAESKVPDATLKRIKALEAAGGPKFSNMLKSKNRKFGFAGSIPGMVGMFAAPMLGRAVAGETGEKVASGAMGAFFVSQALKGAPQTIAAITKTPAGQKMIKQGGKTLATFGAKMAMRHGAAAATVVGANPWVQGAMLLVDLGLGADMIAEMFGFDLIPYI